MKVAAAAATLICLGLAVHAQQPASNTPEQQPTLRVRSNLVFLPTRVQTQKGETIRGLTPDRFIVEDNGVRQSVRVEDSPDDASLSLVVAVQCGRSAATEFSKLKGLGAMIEEIAGGAPHEIAVVVYGERPYLLSDFSNDVETTRLALARVKSCGDYHAATIDAVHFSVNLLERRVNRFRHTILLVGEERDHGSHSKLHEIVEELGVTNTVIYAVAFSPTKSQFLSDLRYGPDGPAKKETPPVVYSAGPPPARTPAPQSAESRIVDPEYTDHAPLFELPPLLLLAVNALRENTAVELASLSGGEYMNFVTQKGLEQALQRVANQVHNYYLLSFQPSLAAPGLHTLQVRVAGRPDATIQMRKNYWLDAVR